MKVPNSSQALIPHCRYRFPNPLVLCPIISVAATKEANNECSGISHMCDGLNYVSSSTTCHIVLLNCFAHM